MHNVFAVQDVVSYGTIDGFLDAQTVGVIDEGRARARLGHGRKLSAILPRICPRAIVGHNSPLSRRSLPLASLCGSLGLHFASSATGGAQFRP